MATLPPEVLANIASRRLNLQQQHDTALQQLGNQYNTNLYNLDQYSREGTGRINDQYAAQGLFNSGIRVDQQGKLQRNVGERRGYLGQQYAAGQSGIESNFANALQGLEEYRTQAMQEATRQELAQQQAAADQAFKNQQLAMQQQQYNQQNWYAAAAAADQRAAQQKAANDAAWYQAAAQRDQQAQDLWNNTILWNETVAQNQMKSMYNDPQAIWNAALAAGQYHIPWRG